MNVTIYPKGFIGNSEGLILEVPKEPDTQDFINAARLNKQIETYNNVTASNKAVNDLFITYQSANEFSKSFEFREQVITVALRAFGTSDFNEWCQMQNESPYFTALHAKFISETLDFIRGVPRQTSLLTWASLLDLTHKVNTDKNIEFTVNEYFEKVSDVVQSWFTNETGVSDLVGTLNILFGNQ
jgi:hypothetical protein